jgi:uncharacterized protein YegL
VTTYVIMVIDKSGSMHPLTSDVRGGFNGYIQTLKEDTEQEYLVTVILFDTEVTELCVAAPVSDVPQLSENNYFASGCTALNDAVGNAITGFDKRVPELGEERVIMWITTDGLENSSHEYSSAVLKSLREAKEATNKWAFIYVGSTPEAWAQAERMGYRSSSRTTHDSYGTRSVYTAAAGATKAYSRGAHEAAVVEYMEKELPKTEE